jgi:methyl-accepting chemotaxis protein
MYYLTELRKVKQVLAEAVQEADTAVKASTPSPDELEKIRESFDESLSRAAKMMAAIRPISSDN